MPKLDTTSWTAHSGGPHPHSGQDDGPYAEIALGTQVGLTHLGARLERLPPGSRSSHRHWHETEDELALVLSGTLVLVENTETVLGPGDAAAWRAGSPVGHCLENRSDADAVFLIVSNRAPSGVVHYPDHGFLLRHDATGRHLIKARPNPAP